MADGEGGSRRAIVRADLALDAAELVFDGLLAEDKRSSNCPIALARREETQHLDFALAGGRCV